ncbi:hypothetical protein D9611_007951 [Ephemerocybe angulata]|uniref:Uncharacterized protein n=1 Tax=Ephemerocybe angulata TaxID=980116 RepID=A0A8H5FK76_9AGAR|nr:hypothetical protein D9611_007951 [Tulosesus angulatus]
MTRLTGLPRLHRTTSKHLAAGGLQPSARGPNAYRDPLRSAEQPDGRTRGETTRRAKCRQQFAAIPPSPLTPTHATHRSTADVNAAVPQLCVDWCTTNRRSGQAAWRVD